MHYSFHRMSPKFIKAQGSLSSCLFQKAMSLTYLMCFSTQSFPCQDVIIACNQFQLIMWHFFSMNELLQWLLKPAVPVWKPWAYVYDKIMNALLSKCNHIERSCGQNYSIINFAKWRPSIFRVMLLSQGLVDDRLGALAALELATFYKLEETERIPRNRCAVSIFW